jgi:hypothetical protein
MSFDEQEFRRFLAETMFRGQETVPQKHLGEDVISLVKDFIAISKSVDKLLSDRSALRADLNNVRGKLDQARSDAKKYEKFSDDFKANRVPAIANEIKTITTSIGKLANSPNLSADEKAMLQGMQAAAKNIVQIILQQS